MPFNAHLFENIGFDTIKTRRGPALRAAPGSREPGCREPGAKALESGGSRRGARAEETARSSVNSKRQIVCNVTGA